MAAQGGGLSGAPRDDNGRGIPEQSHEVDAERARTSEVGSDRSLEQQSDSGSSLAQRGSDAASNVGDKLAHGAGLAGAGLIVGLAKGGKAAGRSVQRLFTRMGMMLLSAGGGLSAMFGGAFSPVAGAVGVGALGAGSLVMATSLVVSMVSTPTAVRDGLPLCTELMSGQQNSSAAPGGTEGTTLTGGELDKKAEEIAKKVWQVYSALGMSDENIAGILGNWTLESAGLDPTAVQNIFDEPYTVGPKKKAVEAMNFGNSGIGMGQWTADRARMLGDFAKSKGKDWYDEEAQLAFSLKADSDSHVIQKMIKNENEGSNDPEAASDYFLDTWERPKYPEESRQKRRDYASMWYVKMGSWDKDNALASSVLAMSDMGEMSANSSADMKNGESIVPGVTCRLTDEGRGSGAGGNEDAAMALATYAWPFYDMGATNNGTELYQWLHREIFPGDPYFKSCDRGVATAVRWSGTDDSFPAGSTAVQYTYVNGEGSDKWEKLDRSEANPDDPKTLKPGDIILKNGQHIGMFLGKDVISKAHSGHSYDKNAEYGQASLDDHSPGLTNGVATPGDAGFEVYRFKGQSDSKSKYKDLKPPMPAESVSGPGE